MLQRFFFTSRLNSPVCTGYLNSVLLHTMPLNFSSEEIAGVFYSNFYLRLYHRQKKQQGSTIINNIYKYKNKFKHETYENQLNRRALCYCFSKGEQRCLTTVYWSAISGVMEDRKKLSIKRVQVRKMKL